MPGPVQDRAASAARPLFLVRSCSWACRSPEVHLPRTSSTTTRRLRSPVPCSVSETSCAIGTEPGHARCAGSSSHSLAQCSHGAGSDTWGLGRCRPTLPADVRLVDAQQLDLDHADARRRRAKALLVMGHAGHLAGPAAAARRQIAVNQNPFQVSLSTQPLVLATAFFHSAYPASRRSALHVGSKVRSALQLARRSSGPDQRPVASPAA